MTDKEKIREEVERLMNELIQEKKKGFGSDADDACILELQNVLTYIDSLQEETKPKFKVGDRIKFKGVRNEYVTRVITNIQKGDEGGFLYLFADGSIYSIDDDGIELVEEPVSEDLEKEIDRAHRIFYEEVGWDSDEGARAYVADWFAHHFANWQKHRMEANRLAHCNSISNEQAELEQKFLDEHLDKYNRMPTFLDAIEYGMRLQKEQMMAKAVDADCFGFQGAALFSFRLPSDKYLIGSKVKVIVIKED